MESGARELRALGDGGRGIHGILRWNGICRFLNEELVGARLAPLAEHQAVRGKEAPDARGIPTKDVFHYGNKHAHRVVAEHCALGDARDEFGFADRKSTRLNSSHLVISYAVFCLKKKNTK